MAAYYYGVGSYDTSGTTLTTAATTNNLVWYEWTAGTAATNVTRIWVSWTTSGTTAGTTILDGSPYLVVAPYVEQRTAQQRADDEARYAARLQEEQQRIAEQEARRKAASVKARALLLSMLEVHQREQLQRDKYFDVIAKHSQRRYRIRQGTHGNVRLLDAQGREVTRFCGQPPGVPTEDAMLAQKLQIEHDEEAFLRAANASQVA